MTSLPGGCASEDRLESLYRIGRLLGEFESLEGTFDAALGIVAGTLPLCSALVIEDHPGAPSLTGWHAASRGERAAGVAGRNVRSVYASLVGEPDEWRSTPEARGPTPLPAVPESCQGTFIVVPLLVVDGPIFGALQVECSGDADERDLRFVAAVGNQLAVALERRRKANAEAERRALAEAAAQRYEGLVDRLDQTFVWEADPRTLAVHYVSAGADALLGHPRGPGALRETERWTDHVHHEDRGAFEDALRRAGIERRPQEVQHRCVLFSGEVRWFHTRVHLSARPDAQPDTLQGITSDITALRAMEARVRERLDFTRTLNASLGDGLVSTDLQGCVTSCNARALDLLGCTELDALGEDLARILRVETAEGEPVIISLNEVARAGAVVRSERHVFRRKDSRTFAAAYRFTPLRRAGQVTGALLAFDDVTERRRGEDARRLIQSARTALGSSLEPAVALKAMARVMLPRLGDLCFVDVAGPDDTTRRLAWAHVEPTRRRLEDDVPYGPEPRGGAPAFFVRETEAEVQAMRMGSVTQAAARDDLTRRLRARSTLTVPLVLGERLLGELTFCFTTSGRRHGEEERSLAHELAHPVALAIEHDNRYQGALQAVKAREASLAVVAHDLRTPLMVIALSARKLGKSPPAPAELDKFRTDLLRVQRSAERLIHTVEDLVDVGSMSTGRFSVRRLEHHPIALLGEAVATFELVPLERDVTLVFEAAAELPLVSCDRDRVLQVFSNLIGNAIKVSPPGGVITLRALERAHEVQFSVSDGGPGIADTTRLFERHWRGSQAGTRGGGLGLTIARGIVEAHGGQIWAESAVGLGTTFSFTLLRAGPIPSPSAPGP